MTSRYRLRGQADGAWQFERRRLWRWQKLGHYSSFDEAQREARIWMYGRGHDARPLEGAEQRAFAAAGRS